MSAIGRLLDPNLIESLRGLELSARSVAEGTTTGLHKSPLRGASIEFHQHRIYVPGDEPRRLDWRLLARTDRPYVKEYDQETNLRCLLMLDCSGSMGYASAAGPKIEYAARLVAALAYLMLGQTESVGLGLFRERIDQWAPIHGGTQQLSRIIDMLERAEPAGPSAPSRAMHEAAERLDRRSLVVVASDLFESAPAVRQGLAHLCHGRHEVILLHVTDRDEEEFSFQDWRRFRGLEGEPPRIGDTAVLRPRYLERFAAHRRHIQESCRTMRADLLSLVTDRPLLAAMREILLRRPAR